MFFDYNQACRFLITPPSTNFADLPFSAKISILSYYITSHPYSITILPSLVLSILLLLSFYLSFTLRSSYFISN